MTAEIALVIAIVVAAVVLFVTERLRVDLIALLVLGSLAVTRLVTPAEALSGFSSPAVVTVWAVFILSGGLSRTGVANAIGRHVLRLAGDGEVRLLVVIMTTTGVLSAFMNNVGVAALMLPVVVEIARRTKRPPSLLLMPLAFGALLGGLTTLIGTPPNILVSDALRELNLEPFELFDFAPVGVLVMVAGLLFMSLLGRRLLPVRAGSSVATVSDSADLKQFYRLQDQLLVLTVPEGSPLAGMSLLDSQMGYMLGLNAIAVIRNGRAMLSPTPGTELLAGDQLLVVGPKDQLSELQGHRVATLERMRLTRDAIRNAGLELANVILEEDSFLAGLTLEQGDIRRRFGLNVLAVRQNGVVRQAELGSLTVQPGDALLVQGPPRKVKSIGDEPGVHLTEPSEHDVAALNECLLVVRVPEDSSLVGKTLEESQLGKAFGLTVLRIARGDAVLLLPEPYERVLANDTLLVQGTEEAITAVRGLERLELDESSPALQAMESANVGLAEAVLSPHTTLAGHSLRELNFREKYGLSVLALWRGGRSYRESLSDIELKFGDAMLLYGPRDKFRLLGSERDFLILTEEAQLPIRSERAPLALAIMALVLLPVILNILPIAIAAVVGAALMILTRCLTMEEAYRFIEWPAVFLIAGMLPLGIAMQNSGAASFLAEGMISAIGGLGPMVMLGGLFVLTTLASQIMPNAAVAVLMAPIALASAGSQGVSPYTYMMGIAIAASASFLSPVSHPANILVMGPGGYRFGDYIRVGLPLTVLVFAVVMITLPIFWPL